MIAAEFLLKRTRISPGTNRAVFFCATFCESLDDWKAAREINGNIAAIETAVGKKAKINRLPEQPGDVPLTCADVAKARRLLKYQPHTRLADGLPKFVEWFRRAHNTLL